MSGTPQFNTVEYSGKPGQDTCRFCNQAITQRYYRVNGAMACSNCAEQAKLKIPEDSHAAFVRGLLFGAGGAIGGLILYAAFGIITGLMIGYVSLAVGYIVGKAIKMGSKGIGGRRYQIAAVLLTYAAVSMAAVPIWIAQAAKQNKAEKPAQVQQSPSLTDEAVAQKGQPPPKPEMSLGAALGAVALAGLASPFLELADPVHGAIGLIILFVGIRIAWQMTAATAMQILGPFSSTPAAPGGPGTA